MSRDRGLAGPGVHLGRIAASNAGKCETELFCSKSREVNGCSVSSLTANRSSACLRERMGPMKLLTCASRSVSAVKNATGRQPVSVSSYSRPVITGNNFRSSHPLILRAAADGLMRGYHRPQEESSASRVT